MRGQLICITKLLTLQGLRVTGSKHFLLSFLKQDLCFSEILDVLMFIKYRSQDNCMISELLSAKEKYKVVACQAEIKLSKFINKF